MIPRKDTILFTIFLFFTFCLVAQEKKEYETDLFFSRKKQFEENPIPKRSKVYLGDSLIQNGKWETYFDGEQPVNRGIIGNNTEGMMQILPEIIAAKPSMVFLIGGINDISQDIPNKVIVNNWGIMIDSIQLYSPDTKIYLHSLLPINNTFKRYKKLLGKEKQILSLNKDLKKLAKSKDITFIDLYPKYTEANKNILKAVYTRDGLHLTSEAYNIWANMDREFIMD